jgi:hypothetical protein
LPSFSEVKTVCLHDFLQTLRADGVTLTEAQLRWAIATGKISRPPLDGSLRFDFGQHHVTEFVTYFRKKQRAAPARTGS